MFSFSVPFLFYRSTGLQIYPFILNYQTAKQYLCFMKYSEMKIFASFVLVLGLCLGFSSAGAAQEKFGGVASLDKTVHNFGDVLLSDGPLECNFTVSNISDKPIAIHSVVSSCGCTNVTWTKAPIAAGKTGTISATYSNDEGAFPFDKTLTAYISGVKAPIVLHLRGVVRQKQEPLDKMYPFHLGKLALKEGSMKIGNMEQGGAVSEEFMVANIGKSPLKVEFRSMDSDLSVRLSANPIPAGKTATMVVTAKAAPERWGRNVYKVTPVVAGVEYGELEFSAVTKENFGLWTKEEKDAASRPMFDSSTYSFGKIAAGKKIQASFTLSNKGRSSFKVYKVDCDNAGLSVVATPDVAAGGKGVYKFTLDTSGMPSGEALVIVSLITNTPNRPLINLYLTGWID